MWRMRGRVSRDPKGNDSYVFSHVSLHFDLFSDPTTRTVDLMYAEAEFDPLFFDDEDGDFVLDVADSVRAHPMVWKWIHWVVPWTAMRTVCRITWIKS